MKKTIKTRDLLLLVACIVGLWSCDKNSEEMKQEPSVAPGIYSTEITVSAEQGKSSQVSTRGLDANLGQFNNTYPYNYIYIHSADNKEDDSHKSLQVPLKDVEYCDECRGIHLEVEVLAEGSGYTITNENGQSISLSANEKVYFSTIDSPFWKPEIEGATPVSKSNVFVESGANQELLSSISATGGTYGKDELVALIQDPLPKIELTRHCTAFRIYFMFTYITKNGSTNNVIVEPEFPYTNHWITELGNIDYKNFYIKLYLGPNFASKYDILNDRVTVDDQGGYYSTNRQQYQPFTNVNYSFTGGGSSDNFTYQGFGYVTSDYKYLISPLNLNYTANDFCIYTFIKYNANGGQVDDGYLASDAGSKYFKTIVPAMTMDTNIVHYIILAYDLRDLKVFTEAASTASLMTRSPWEGPEEIDIKPVKVICK